MNLPTEKQIIKTLQQCHKERKLPLVFPKKYISSLTIKDDQIGVIFDIPEITKEHVDILTLNYEHQLKKLDGVSKVIIIFTSQNIQKPLTAPPTEPKKRPAPPTPNKINNIKKIYAVISGKGGVGKSTIASNLAIALAMKGHATGLVDADIYGPSVAKMMGINDAPDVENKQMIPPIAHDVKCMSMGFLLKDDMPAVWRGPMLAKAIHQLMLGADWGSLDYLIIDMPPGTGDVPLSIAQNFVIDAAIVVSTPQEVALIDAKKSVNMLHKMNIPIIGIVENMSYIDAGAKNRLYPFGKGNVQKYANDENIPLLESLPILDAISSGGDNGKPHACTTSDSYYSKIADAVIAY